MIAAELLSPKPDPYRRLPLRHRHARRRSAWSAAAVLVPLLTSSPAAGQDFFPGFEVAAQADVVLLTSNVLARLDDQTCAFEPEVLAREAKRALRRHGINVIVLTEPVVEGVNLDVSALVLPVLDTDACAVATRIQLAVGGDAVLLAAEHFNLLTWTATELLRRVRAAVDQDVSTIAEAIQRAGEAGR